MEGSVMSFDKRLIPTLVPVFLCAALLSHSSLSRAENVTAYTNDTVITAKVKAALLHTAGLNSTEITVETYKGIVKLSGFIESKSEIKTAIATAKRVQGVRSVENDLSVKCN
jgi:osmotically-inducible protein OsmY